MVVVGRSRRPLRHTESQGFRPQPWQAADAKAGAAGKPQPAVGHHPRHHQRRRLLRSDRLRTVDCGRYASVGRDRRAVPQRRRPAVRQRRRRQHPDRHHHDQYLRPVQLHRPVGRLLLRRTVARHWLRAALGPERRVGADHQRLLVGHYRSGHRLLQRHDANGRRRLPERHHGHVLLHGQRGHRRRPRHVRATNFGPRRGDAGRR